ncbi:hypothetical protein ACVMIH_006155 [Bradyrhizobium sp. USDA 4503]|uniref:hypothetical protein n=1 Tax=Bradyrhizobium TaxID=374 RepID=UPI001E335928|nr:MULTISPECIES: hypothetical protein [Bradyrhizobium]MCC8951344.1 hypothetical protein [Bradyrhizobium brasilense]MCP1836760.1 hypothetical protein [Bradyrhizobium sp. USDA 4545]MCP1921508.1 hypothetical protein [Bradyrhizobium sp. USDA 4532]
MRHARIAELTGSMSRLGLTVVAASLMLASAVRAADIKQLTERLPHAYIGEFLWDGDTTVQHLVITFDKVQALNEQNAEARGCGSYEVGGHVTKIGVQMFIRLSDLEVELFERSPDDSGSFETEGSHRGKLSEDFQQIDAQWTTTANGKHGQLHLRAAASAACEPAAEL